MSDRAPVEAALTAFCCLFFGACITPVPAELLDGDSDTTYTAGAGMLLSASNEFAVDQGAIEGFAQGVCYDTSAEVVTAIGAHYADADAIAAVGAHYTNAEAVSAMGGAADGNTLNHNRYTSAEAVSAVGAHYNDAAAVAAIAAADSYVLNSGDTVTGNLSVDGAVFNAACHGTRVSLPSTWFGVTTNTVYPGTVLISETINFPQQAQIMVDVAATCLINAGQIRGFITVDGSFSATPADSPAGLVAGMMFYFANTFGACRAKAVFEVPAGQHTIAFSAQVPNGSTGNINGALMTTTTLACLP